MTGAALVLATLWLIPRVLARGLRPLASLGEQVAAIDSRTLSTRFSADTLPKELRPIAVRLNDLLARLEESFERERRFTSDLAHELRTPIAELRSGAECTLKWPETRSPDADRETLAIADQMARIVEHMLSLARSEHGLLRLSLEPVALGELVRRRWARLEERAAARGLRVELNVEARTADADPALLRAVLDNLLENAVDHATAGGRVAISAPASGPALLRIGNCAAELKPADLPRLFERFWRKEAARSDHRHLGLGLSLAQSFAQSMGMRLEAAMPEPGFLEITLLAGPPPPQS